MKPSNMIPTVALVVAIIGSGAMVATAQNLPTPEGAAAQVQQAEFRGFGRHEGRDDDDHRGGMRMMRHEGGEGREGRGGFGGHGGGGAMLKLFGEVDANDDGKVDQAEIDAYRSARIGAADASGDGQLSIEEFETLYRDFTRDRMVDAFQNLDDDGNGQITSDELDARFGNIIERMDRNGDGVLSIEDRGKRG